MRTRFLMAWILLLSTTPITAPATTITVTNTNDSGPGSLRQALTDANDGDTITFAVTGSIVLTSGQLLVDKSVTISGPGTDNLTVSGNATSRVFYIASDTTVTISNLTTANGNPPGSPPDDYGAGIYNDHATLTLNNCAIRDNLASFGGGVYNNGFKGTATLTLNNCTITGNSTDFHGGGIFNDGAIMDITNSTVSGNSALFFGGGIFNNGFQGNATLTLKESTLSGNSASTAGGIFNDGIFGNATLQLVRSTLSENLADDGGGIVNAGESGIAVVEIGSTVLNAGASGQNIVNQPSAGSIVMSLGYNLSSDDGGGVLIGPGDQINTNPLLGPLQDNGGPTLTHGVLPGSPAIDAGDPDFTPPPFYDQRGPGFDRVVNGRIDKGSFEVQGPGPTPTPTATPTPTPTPTVTPTPTATPTPRPIPTPRARPAPKPRPTPFR